MLRIATFNLWKNEGDFPARIEKIAQNIPHIDMLFLQEDFHAKGFSSSDCINTSLKYQKYTTCIRKKKRAQKMSSSNLTLLSECSVHLKKEIFFDKESEDERACQLFESTIQNNTFLFAHVHLTNFSTQRRKKALKKILKIMAAYEYDFHIILGDFNANESSFEIHMVEKEGFTSYNKHNTFEHKEILDFIFVKTKHSLSVNSCVILDDLSDHGCLLYQIKEEKPS
jgi:endonuclease/exonuclease/phosphatase family metal-dependent hydrolase